MKTWGSVRNDYALGILPPRSHGPHNLPLLTTRFRFLFSRRRVTFLWVPIWVVFNEVVFVGSHEMGAEMPVRGLAITVPMGLVFTFQMVPDVDVLLSFVFIHGYIPNGGRGGRNGYLPRGRTAFLASSNFLSGFSFFSSGLVSLFSSWLIGTPSLPNTPAPSGHARLSALA